MPDLLASLPAHPARPTCADRSETFDADIAIERLAAMPNPPKDLVAMCQRARSELDFEELVPNA